MQNSRLPTALQLRHWLEGEEGRSPHDLLQLQFIVRHSAEMKEEVCAPS